MQVVGYGDAILFVGDPRDLQVEVVDFRHPPGGMHDQVGFKRLLLPSCPRMHQEARGLTLNRHDLRLQANFDAKFFG